MHRFMGWRAAGIGYTAAVVVPVLVTLLVAWFRLPPFVFEHVVVLLVVGTAVPWGLGPAVLTAVVSVLADDLLLREPVGIPTITGYRDALDLALFATVAVIVSSLVRRAHAARREAELAAERERHAREDRDRLIATVTHDLTTPLSVLSGTLQFARRFGGRPDVDLERLLARLETASARATSLVRTLADARALEVDGFGLRMEPRDVRALVAPIIEMMDRFSERHPVVLAASDTPVIASVDAERFKRVIENLVNNAIKYSPGGGAVEVSIAEEEHDAVVRVRDYGIGIAPDALPRIFDRSYRGPEAAAHATGLGLGLTIAAEIVTRHGGTIAATPADGRGTVFTLRLPRHAGETPSAPGDEQATPAYAAGSGEDRRHA